MRMYVRTCVCSFVTGGIRTRSRQVKKVNTITLSTVWYPIPFTGRTVCELHLMLEGLGMKGTITSEASRSTRSVTLCGEKSGCSGSFGF